MSSLNLRKCFVRAGDKVGGEGDGGAKNNSLDYNLLVTDGL